MRKRSYVSHLRCQIYVSVGHGIPAVLLVTLGLFFFVEDQIESRSFCRVIFVFGSGCLSQIEKASLVDKSSNQAGAFVFAQDTITVNIASKRWSADEWFGCGQLACFDVEGVAFCEIVYSNVPHLEVFAGDFVGIGDIGDEDSIVAVDGSDSVFVEETGLFVDSYTNRSL
jgi:hypothetical protein